MRKTKEILRQKWHLKRPRRAIAASVKVSVGTVSEVASRAEKGGVELGTGREDLEEMT